MDSVRKTNPSRLHRPKNWGSNTFVVAAGIGILSYGLWNLSSDLEVCLFDLFSSVTRLPCTLSPRNS